MRRRPSRRRGSHVMPRVDRTDRKADAGDLQRHHAIGKTTSLGAAGRDVGPHQHTIPANPTMSADPVTRDEIAARASPARRCRPSRTGSCRSAPPSTRWAGIVRPTRRRHCRRETARSQESRVRARRTRRQRRPGRPARAASMAPALRVAQAAHQQRRDRFERDLDEEIRRAPDDADCAPGDPGATLRACFATGSRHTVIVDAAAGRVQWVKRNQPLSCMRARQESASCELTLNAKDLRRHCTVGGKR